MSSIDTPARIHPISINNTNSSSSTMKSKTVPQLYQPTIMPIEISSVQQQQQQCLRCNRNPSFPLLHRNHNHTNPNHTNPNHNHNPKTTTTNPSATQNNANTRPKSVTTSTWPKESSQNTAFKTPTQSPQTKSQISSRKPTKPSAEPATDLPKTTSKSGWNFVMEMRMATLNMTNINTSLFAVWNGLVLVCTKNDCVREVLLFVCLDLFIWPLRAFVLFVCILVQSNQEFDSFVHSKVMNGWMDWLICEYLMISVINHWLSLSAIHSFRNQLYIDRRE